MAVLKKTAEDFAREQKEISISEVFKEGQAIDAHSLTRGKGFQGPMKRFGIQLRHHKSEKSRRNRWNSDGWKRYWHRCFP